MKTRFIVIFLFIINVTFSQKVQEIKNLGIPLDSIYSEAQISSIDIVEPEKSEYELCGIYQPYKKKTHSISIQTELTYFDFNEFKSLLGNNNIKLLTGLNPFWNIEYSLSIKKLLLVHTFGKLAAAFIKLAF